MKKILLTIISFVTLLVSILLINTLRFPARQVQIKTISTINIDEDVIAQHLAQALRFRTVARQGAGQFKGKEFLAFHAFLERTFPQVHSMLVREVVGEYSLLYTWKGRDDKMKPILLMAHQDVVSVKQETEAAWQQSPFDGRISGGFIWGRGAMDDKSGLMGILEAVEMLLTEGFQPKRTVYLAFGHDEEAGGNDGAARIAALLRARNVGFEYILDEGLVITDGIVPVPAPVALIGIAEKGYVSLELTVEDQGGHSSMPPLHTAIGILSAAIKHIEERQMSKELRGVVGQMFDYLVPEMPFGKRLVFANLWLFGPLVERRLSESPSTNAALRTTTAVTIIEGGIKANVLPTKARAVANFRILPGDSIEGVIAHVRDVIKDPRVKIGRHGDSAWEPSTVSDANAGGFQVLQRTIRQMFPDVVVAPGLVLGATDSRHYATLTNNIYRFRPHRYRPEDMKRYHGIDERISLENHAQGVRFYDQLIRNSAQ